MKRDAFYSTISAASAALMLALMWIAATFWTVADYGIFSYAITIATIAEVLMDLGLHQVTIRSIARQHDRAAHLLRTTVLLKAAPGLLMIVAFGLGVTWVRDGEVVRTACWLMLGAAAMRSYLLTARGIFQGLGRFGDDAFVTTADRVLLLVACGTAIWTGGSVVQVSIVFLISRMISAAGALWLARLRSGLGRFDRDLARMLPAEAIPVGLFLLVLNLYNRIDMTMLGSMGPDEMTSDVWTGIYGAAYTVYEGLTYPTAVLSAVLAPRLSRSWQADPAAFRRLVGLGMAGAVALAVLVGLASWPLAGIAMHLYSPNLDPAAQTLRILLLGLPPIYAIWVLHGVAIAAHRTRVLIYVTAFGTVLNIALNLWWIPQYSYNGSAAATVVSEYVVSGVLWAALRTAARGRGPRDA